MSGLQFLNQGSLLGWLKLLKFDYHLCGQCQGIHITEVQDQEGVIESRLFLETDRLIYTTELDVRQSTLLSLNSEVHKLNGTYANIKLFLDLADSCPSRLVVCDSQWMSAGLTQRQFGKFLRAAIDAKIEIIDLLTHLSYLDILSEESIQLSPSGVLH